MSNTFSKIKRELSGVCKNFHNDTQFSLDLAFSRFGEYLSGRLHLSHLNNRCRLKRFKAIREYLSSLLSPISQKYIEESTIMGGCVNSADAPIFVMWWQGEEKAPEIVKKCIESIRSHAGTHPVKIVDQQNVKNYLDIPEYISRKVSNGQMCLANFSDYIRVSLLNKYGGLWLDATLFAAYDIPEEYFSMPMYTCNSVRSNMGTYVSGGRWATFCLGCWKDNLYTRFVKDCFELYWHENNSSIDYLVYDFLTDKAYSDLPAVREAIDTIPLNNQRRNDLAAAMVRGKPSEEFQKIVQPDTVLYKLSWREHYPLITKDGKETVYYYFLNSLGE